MEAAKHRAFDGYQLRLTLAAADAEKAATAAALAEKREAMGKQVSCAGDGLVAATGASCADAQMHLSLPPTRYAQMHENFTARDRKREADALKRAEEKTAMDEYAMMVATQVRMHAVWRHDARPLSSA